MGAGAQCLGSPFIGERRNEMKDLTERINAFGEAKRALEDSAHRAKVLCIEEYMAQILSHSEELDTAIANANAAIDAGIKLKPFGDTNWIFEDNDFIANGIKHRLGFVRACVDGEVVGLAVIGGGANGDVSAVYKNGEVFYDTDKYYNHSILFQSRHGLDGMSDGLLADYAYAFKTFVNDIDPFCRCFEYYLEDVISNLRG